MAGLSPTQRTIRALKQQGVVCGVVERWLPYAKRDGDGPPGIRQDLFGIIDIIALDMARGVIGVQACGQDFAAHYRKLTETCAQQTFDWLSTPGTNLEIWAWRKVKKARGGKAMIWAPRIEVITIDKIGR
jgi:hypothetical protein